MQPYGQAKYILDFYGLRHQKAKMIEELAELIVALQKNLLTDTEDLTSEILEEIADTLIMILQLLAHKCEYSKVYEIMDYKINRQIERIKAEVNR